MADAVPLRRRGVEAHLLPQRVLEVLVRVDGVAALVLEVEREVAHDPHERGEVPLEVPLAWVVVLGDPDVLRQVRHERQVGDGVLVDRPQGIVAERRAEQRGQGEEPRVVVAVRLEPAEALHVQQHDRARLARRERGPDGRAPQPDAARAPPHPVADREVPAFAVRVREQVRDRGLARAVQAGDADHAELALDAGEDLGALLVDGERALVVDVY